MKTCYNNLRDFIEFLESKEDVKRIRTEVSSYLEISRFTDHESKSPDGGKALLFEKVRGSSFPVVTNAFGSPRRICQALGVDHLDQLGERIEKLLNMGPPENIRQFFHLVSSGLAMTQFFPRRHRKPHPPCQEVVHTGKDVDLSTIPVLHCWPLDGGPFVTLPLVFTRSLVTGKQNAGMYRMQIYDRNTTGMHWHIHKDGSHYYNEYCRAKKRMPVAVAVGTDPATTYAATAPLPRGVDEMILAGFIRQKPVYRTRCLTVDLEVPAEAEFVLEGYVDPGETRAEGPFGDHTGYYSPVDLYPVFHVTAITHRRDAIYSATLVGRPPMEDCYLAKATERLFLPLLKSMFPEIRDYWFPWEGVFHNIVIVSAEKEYPGQAQKLMSGLWGQGQMSFCKAIVVVDETVDPKDPRAVLRELIRRTDIDSDIWIIRGVLDVLDHSAANPLFGAKIGIDLTNRVPGEPDRKKHTDVQIPSVSLSPVQGIELAGRSLQGITSCYPLDEPGKNRIILFGVAKTPERGGDYFARGLQEIKELENYNIMILYDKEIELSDSSLVLWKLFNNVDPERDFYRKENRLIVDACRKGPAEGYTRKWPDDILMEQ
ncbi:MAG: menaquinone biosynthesis decarboxylase [Deltaproteobacteria bacterium]|jgi:4-hydroxy-3-polyprenylbenzoate decarboxylase|nr:menaquinone biosynthesis decarboxylase [Deltaproteobacteria bacterium]